MKPWEYHRRPVSTSERVAEKDFQTNESESYNLGDWQGRFKELRVEHPNGIILNAQPRHVHDAMGWHSWGVIYTPERFLLTTWGDVPRYALIDKRGLETGELLIPEQVAA